jgi:hypothetical protein
LVLRELIGAATGSDTDDFEEEVERVVMSFAPEQWTANGA